MGSQEDCPHLELAQDITPNSPDSCPQCVELGDTWVQLRACLICGQVGCCDSSKNKHATTHYHETSHPVMQSFEPGEGWRYCYVDGQMLSGAEPFRAT
jgi:CPA2 family monovalent cation:H+ antiporter-2